ncbi:MAG: glutathione S-transferase N-terminal domain-containing protein [Bradymonadaceae bacterium]|nr:glutathione S-transferase N-terminal domain-containing protein [Lujinxingiaceae bacterium]
MRIYNIVGTDGSWFSPFGWRARAVLLCKRIPVEWVDVPISELASAVAFAGTTTTPLLVERLVTVPGTDRGGFRSIFGSGLTVLLCDD